jgi:hypothetical protein
MTYAQARRWWRKREHDKQKNEPVKVRYASTSPRTDGALWRDLGGVTHVLWGWCLEDYQQVTSCGLLMRNRRGDWLYEALGLAPTFTNCVTCTAYIMPAPRYHHVGTVTGRMSYGANINFIRRMRLP